MIEWRPRGWRMLEWRPSVGLDVGGALLAVGAGTIAVALSTTGAGAAHLGQAIGAPTQTVTVSTSGAGATAPFMSAAGTATQTITATTAGAGAAHLGQAVGAATQTVTASTTGAGAAHLGQAIGAPTQTITATTTGAGVTDPFVPWDLPNCIVALRADLGITLNGANVAAWADQTGLGNNVVQGVAANQPLWVASGGPNNKSYVEGDGVDEFLRAAFAWTQPAHIFVVAMPSATDGINKALYDGGVNNGALFYTATSTQMACYAGGALTEGAGGTHMNTWSKIDTLWNGAASYIRRNGVTKTGNVGANNPSGIILLMRGDQASNAGDGRICEAVGFTAEVTGNAYTLMDWYINARYSL